MEGFKHKTPIQIRFKDVDMMGHVNNANHFTYLEIARAKYFDDVVAEEVNWSKEGIILAKLLCNYKMPILFKDKVFVYTKCAKIGNKSFELDYKIIKEENSKEIILAEASSVQVCFDYEKKENILMPEKWRKKIEAFEK
ncbi:MAG: acyl-CoA thioesterase [Bacteroidetes bacterium]|nr:acyl-CoA thioesterase [Bacteroidota bacterium]